MRLETSLYNLWVQCMTWICRQRRHLRPCNPWQKKPSQGSCFHRAPSLTISGLIMFYYVLSILFTRLQCVNVLEPTTLGFCAFWLAESYVWCAAWTGTWHLSQQRTRSDNSSCDVLWCAMIDNGSNTLGNRWVSMRLVETRWDLRTSSTDLKGPHFLFLRSFSNLYNLSSSSPSLSQYLCFLSAAHRWDWLGLPGSTTPDRRKTQRSRAKSARLNLLKSVERGSRLMLSHVVSCCLMMPHISSSLCHCTCPSSLLQWLQTLQCYTATLASAFGPDSSVQAVWSPRSSSLVFSIFGL